MRSALFIQSSTSSAQRKARTVAMLHQAAYSAFEPLESRRMFAITAVSAGGVLNVLGDNGANAITVSRDTAGKLLVNNGAVKILGSTATVANINSIKIFGFNGNDTLALDETNGVLPKASLVGGNGNDSLTGGSGADVLTGNNGNDLLLGKGGNDSLFGGSGNDTLTGGVGTDLASGQSGNDRMIWNPGEGSDTNEGGAGNDTVEVNGGNVDETFTATAVNGRVRFDRTSPGPFFIDIGTSENLILNANGGNDTFTGGVGLAPLISIQVDGGAGNDTITGGDGVDTLRGGDGNDSINGGKGNDLIYLGAGDDTFVWNPGEGSDVVEGQAGADTMVFNGADGAENVDISANGNRLRFFRDAGNITMDTNDVEIVAFNAKGGADSVIVHNLSGTDVTRIDINLQDTTGGEHPADRVIVEGTTDDDAITVTGTAASGVEVSGLFATVRIIAAKPADKLIVNALAGDDVVDASGLDADILLLTVDGGAGDDFLTGSAGNDSLLGGDDDDVLVGGLGNDQVDGSAGDNVLVQ